MDSPVNKSRLNCLVKSFNKACFINLGHSFVMEWISNLKQCTSIIYLILEEAIRCIKMASAFEKQCRYIEYLVTLSLLDRLDVHSPLVPDPAEITNIGYGNELWLSAL